jgi:hypothetical protein
MKKNVANWERTVRAMAGSGMLAYAAMAPLSLLLRVAVLGVFGMYMLGTALAGTCLGYKLMGRSTCPASPETHR